MKSTKQIEARLAEVLADERLARPSATTFENAALALAQTALETFCDALRWVLDDTAASAPTHYDVRVFVAGRCYHLCDNFRYQLTCNRIAGWQLWNGGRLLGGEYEGGEFKIEIGDFVVLWRTNRLTDAE